MGELDLCNFGQREPSWEEIEGLAQTILDKYVARDDFTILQEMPHSECDMKRENQMLFNQDGLMYTLLALASNMGTVGLMKDLLWLWIPVFLACRKHKYTTHLSKFLCDLHDTYPERLSRVIQLHWLCNPKGTPDGFRGIDWWVELNNLYTKVCQ